MHTSVSRTVATALTVLVVGAPALGQPGTVGVFADQIGATCALVDDSPGTISFYVVHINYLDGASGVEFWAPIPPCMVDVVVLADTEVFAGTSGTSQTGVTINYGQCLTISTHVLTINLAVQGSTPNCCCYYVYPLPPSTSSRVVVSDCLGGSYFAEQDITVVNPDPSCNCNLTGDPDPENCANAPVPVVETTWGRVKAQYERW